MSADMMAKWYADFLIGGSKKRQKTRRQARRIRRRLERRQGKMGLADRRRDDEQASP